MSSEFELSCDSIYSTDNVHTIRNVWLIGDAFLRNIFTTFRAMRQQATLTKKAPPFLFAHYNVDTMVTPPMSNVQSVLARIYNAFIKALNENHHLPRYVIILLDKDIIVYIDHFDFSISKTIEDVLKWLLININQAIETRKQDLLGKRPGAISSLSEPRLIWVQMVKRQTCVQFNQEV